MSTTESPPNHNPTPPSPRDDSGDRILVIINYVLGFVAIANGLTLLIAAILAYVRKDQATPMLKSHFEFQIASFWYGVAIFLIGLVTIWIFFLGALIWLLGGIWLVVRTAVGLIRLIDGRSHDNPWGFWF